MQQLLIVTLEKKRSRLASLPSICSFPHKNSAFHDLRVGLCVRRRRGRKAQVAQEQLGWGGGKPPTRKCRQAPERPTCQRGRSGFTPIWMLNERTSVR